MNQPTELEQMRAMLDRIGVEYDEHTIEDWERGWEPPRFQSSEELVQAFQQAYNKPWREATSAEIQEFLPGHPKPGWTSLHPKIGYIDTELVYDPEGDLTQFWQNE